MSQELDCFGDKWSFHFMEYIAGVSPMGKFNPCC